MAADPVKKRPQLIPVDENFVAPENPTPGEKYQGDLAAQKREGRRLQKIEQVKAVTALENEIKGIKSAHVDELNRVSSVARTTGYWRGFAIGGMIVGALVGTALAIYAAAIINPAFDAAARMQMQQSVVDTMQRGAQP